ncbi:MAG: hypothetical protein AAF721_02720 [Myxococcota bacterium]
MKQLCPLALTLLLPACFSPEPFGGEDTDGAGTSSGAEESSEADDGELPADDAEDLGSTGEEPGGSTGGEDPGVDDEDGTTGGVEDDGEELGDETFGDETFGDTFGDDTDGGDTGEPIVPQRVFVTSATYDASQVALADQRCQLAANNAGLGGNWVAWVSGALGDAVDRLPADGGPWVLLDEAHSLVAEDVADLTDGSIATAISVDQDGDAVGAPFAVWTGTGVSGTKDVDTCLDWTVATSAQDGMQGNHAQTTGSWTRALSPYCSTNARLYCFEI